ncbi:MAG: integration host factor subunit alpha [Pseudomonadota bacterium]
MTLTKADIVDSLVQELNVSRKDAVNYTELVFETIKETLERGDNVKISGFGNWNVRSKQSRVGRNPQTGQAMEISSRKVVTFKPSQVLRDVLAGIETPVAKEDPVAENTDF